MLSESSPDSFPGDRIRLKQLLKTAVSIGRNALKFLFPETQSPEEATGLMRPSAVAHDFHGERQRALRNLALQRGDRVVSPSDIHRSVSPPERKSRWNPFE